MPNSRSLWLWVAGLLLALLAATLPAQAQPTDIAPSPPTYSTLADLLENEQSRNRMIEELRSLAHTEEGVVAPLGLEGEVSAEAIAAAAPSGQSADDVSLARRLAVATSSIAGDIGGQFNNIVSVVGSLFSGQAATGGSQLDMAAISSVSINLALVIIATVALFLGFRRAAKPAFSRLSLWSQSATGRTPLLRLIIAVAAAAVVDVLVVAMAYVLGNLVATFVIGDTGELSTQASLFLNAFLVIELFKVALRMLFSSRYEGLRLIPISASEASYWNRWIARLIGLIGYGLLVIVPLINFYLSSALGQAVSALIMLGAFIYAVAFVLKNRLKVRQGIENSASRATMHASRLSLQLFARTWHWLAILYFLMVLVVTLVRPSDALPFVMIATLKTVLAIGAGILISSLLTQIIGHRITLPDDLRRQLPLLEPRLNAYVPNALRFIRAIILIVVVMLAMNAWGIFDIMAWYASDTGRTLVGTIISIAVILTLAAAAWLTLASLIESRLYPNEKHGEPKARTKTLLTLFRNALAIALITITTMILLSEIGINIGPLIAGAGVLGLAIGFGAQKLVQDIITGVFIQLENAMNTGDVVTVGGVTGTAERITIRSVGIRDLSGTYHIVPFSSVDTVANYMREFGNHLGEYNIAYRENVDDAIVQLEAAFEELRNGELGHHILEPLFVAGVIELGNNAVRVRVSIKTTPGDQWAVGRAYNRLVKMYFDNAGIEVPFPHTTLYFGQDKTGSAPPANLRIMQQDFTIDGSPAGQPKPAGSQTDDRHQPSHDRQESRHESLHESRDRRENQRGDQSRRDGPAETD